MEMRRNCSRRPMKTRVSDLTDLPRAILAAVPGTMRQISDAVGVEGEEVWAVVREMRRAGFLRRSRGRIYTAGKTPMPDGWNLAPEVLAAARAKGGKRKRHTVIASVPGWPPLDPGRPLVFESFSSPASADAEMQRLMASVPDVEWHVEPLTRREQRELESRPVPDRGLDREGQAGEGAGGDDAPKNGVIRGDATTNQQDPSDQ